MVFFLAASGRAFAKALTPPTAPRAMEAIRKLGDPASILKRSKPLKSGGAGNIFAKNRKSRMADSTNAY